MVRKFFWVVLDLIYRIALRDSRRSHVKRSDSGRLFPKKKSLRFSYPPQSFLTSLKDFLIYSAGLAKLEFISSGQRVRLFKIHP